jgi:two-component system response regulator AtoC
MGMLWRANCQLSALRMSQPYVFGNPERMKDLERRIVVIACSGLPVLIEGASGTRKEALAQLLHELSGASVPFIRILCRQSGPALNPAASHVDGAAELSEINRSTRGTLFLKSVHLLSSSEQEQLLTALEQASDSTKDKDNDAAGSPRLVSSTTESLDPLVGRRELNPALYHRLTVHRICLPLLRERHRNIPELFEHMVRRAVNGSGAPPLLTPRLLDVLMAYNWPGNLRELQNIARAYVITGDAEEIIAELGNRSLAVATGYPAQGDNWSLKQQRERRRSWSLRLFCERLSATIGTAGALRKLYRPVTVLCSTR